MLVTWSDTDMNTGWRDLSETLQWMLQHKTIIKVGHASVTVTQLQFAWYK